MAKNRKLVEKFKAVGIEPEDGHICIHKFEVTRDNIMKLAKKLMYSLMMNMRHRMGIRWFLKIGPKTFLGSNILQ